MAPFFYHGFKEWSPEELREGWTVSSVPSRSEQGQRSPDPPGPQEMAQRLQEALSVLRQEVQTSSAPESKKTGSSTTPPTEPEPPPSSS